MARRRTIDLAVIAAVLVLLVALAALRTTQTANQTSVPSTYDTGANGYAALYDLLAAERIRVERFELPVGRIPAGGTLVIAGDGALDRAVSSTSSARALDRWVRAGGTLVVLDGEIARSTRRALHLSQARTIALHASARTGCAFAGPLHGARVRGEFRSAYAPSCTAHRASLLLAGSSAPGIAYHAGRGRLVLVTAPGVLDNLHLAHADNARIAYALLAGTRVVRFDEYVYGHNAGAGFWDVLPQPVRIAVVIALLAAVLAIAGANLPFAPPHVPQPPEERDSGAYIASVAQMLERGEAAGEALLRIAARCEHVLAPRAGFDDRARMLLREMRTLRETPRPGTHEMLAAGRIFARMRKDYGC